MLSPCVDGYTKAAILLKSCRIFNSEYICANMDKIMYLNPFWQDKM